MITGGGHHDNVSPKEKEKETMAKTYQAPLFVLFLAVEVTPT
jgi:hypothetical protein